MIKISPVKTISAFTALLIIGASQSAHACTPPKSDYKNVSCTAQQGIFIATKDNGSPVALLNSRGQKTLELFGYQAALPAQLRSGLLPVIKNGKVGYINQQGKTVINFQYDRMPTGSWARGVSDDRVITYANGRYVILGSNGRLIRTFDRSVSHISDYANGVATVTQNNQRYQIDKQGNRLSESTPSDPAISANQTAHALNTPTHPPESSVSIQAHISPSNASQGSKIAMSLIKKEQNGKWGFVDEHGNLRILYAFDEVKDYSEGMAAVRQGNYWGFIDEKADLVINFQFHKDGIHADSKVPPFPAQPLQFKNGKAWIGNLGNGFKMCIDQKGMSTNCSPALNPL
ncbi:WG repeat-containing protein [Moraxella canis]|uniref:WG repeat-containing protein n=1 Tax=Moraxella canis TaxID=90239 RepID=A0A1S9ZIP9_9GAMM|nr:WG repeat-containing protein [Moraxella canis]OOR83395.1 hypothetical protein B0180_07500 [Moraxella canis]